MDKSPPLPGQLDAIVCGGGPGGSTCATVLARKGLRVALFEREKFPRFHVGESLLPYNVDVFERIGVAGKLAASKPQVKHGARFYHQGTDYTRFVKFAKGMDDQHPTAYQVKRAEFDQLLLDHSRESGAHVFEEARVEEALFDATGRATGVKVRLPGDGEPRVVEARVVIDATGRDALMSRALGGRERDPRLDRTSAFAHYDGFHRAEGPEGGDIVIVTTPDGWWWLIPFSDGAVSVGFVMPSARFKERKGSVEELFEAQLQATKEVRELLLGQKRTSPVHLIADYSYRSKAFRGDGYVLVGDAAGFVDPVFSSGVLLAMRSGELAGNAIVKALAAKGRVDAADFRDVEAAYKRAVARFEKFVLGFYQPHMLETFYTPAPNDWIGRGVTTVLAGGVFEVSAKARLGSFVFHACAFGFRIAQAFRGKGAFAQGAGLVEAEN